MPASLDRSLGDGVYYAPNDYVGLGPRLVILFVDSFVLLAGLMILGTLGSFIPGMPPPLTVLVLASFVWWYEVPLKRSKYRTLGYLLMGCKIVNLKGEQPSLLMLTLRALM